MPKTIITTTGYDIKNKVVFKREYAQIIPALPIPPLGVSAPELSLPQLPALPASPSLDTPSIDIGLKKPQIPALPNLALPIPPLGISAPLVSLPQIPSLPEIPIDIPGGTVVRIETSTRVE